MRQLLRYGRNKPGDHVDLDIGSAAKPWGRGVGRQCKRRGNWMVQQSSWAGQRMGMGRGPLEEKDGSRLAKVQSCHVCKICQSTLLHKKEVGVTHCPFSRLECEGLCQSCLGSLVAAGPCGCRRIE